VTVVDGEYEDARFGTPLSLGPVRRAHVKEPTIGSRFFSVKNATDNDGED
jgi:hypothetical protein